MAETAERVGARGNRADKVKVSAMGPWLELQEGAEYIRMSYRYIKRIVGEREIRSYPIAKNRTLLKRADLDEWVEKHRREAL